MQESLSSGPMTPADYAKIRAVLAQIQGLRLAIIGTALGGVAVVTLVFMFSLYSNTFTSPPTNNPVGSALYLSAAVALPFVMLAGYLSTRIDKHINRLSRGKYERPVLVE